MLIDSHCHLTKRFYEDPKLIIQNAVEQGVGKMICVGTSLEDSKEAIDVANTYPEVYAAVGVHPEETCNNWGEFERLISRPKVVAIGECGLDNKVGSRVQKETFQRQIDLAKKYDKPLIIHIREAWEEVKEFDLSLNRGVFHCYSGPPEIPPNFYVSFAGNVTFKNAPNLQAIAKLIPLSSILVETDSPLLSPVPFRGKQNEPKNVKIIAEYIASLKDLNIEEVEQVTSQNAKKLFGLN